MGLRQQLDAIEPHFKPGGRFESWYALYEAVDTIFYSPDSVTKANAHVRDGIDLKRIMITVWLATFPAMFYGMYNIGLQANDVLAASGGALDGWRGGLVAALGGHDPANVWHNMLYGLVHFSTAVPGDLYGGRLLGSALCHAPRSRGERGVFRYVDFVHPDIAARPTAMAGSHGHQLWCCDW